MIHAANDGPAPTHRPAERYVTLITPVGRGAIATLAVTGNGAFETVAGLFLPASGRMLSETPRRRIVFGRWASSGEEVIACVYGLDQIEVHCHGGRQAAECIAESLIQAGCKSSDGSDWARRVAPGQIERQAWRLLAQARSLRTAGVLLDQQQGALRREFEIIRSLAADAQSASRDLAQARVQVLLARAPLGCHLATPFQVVLAGPPNVGKSSLVNAILGFERAVVFDQPGTTRDVVTANTAVAGWPVGLSDTAGLRVSEDPLEQAGMRLTADRLRQADLAVLVFDARRPWTDADERLSAQWPGAVLAFNKLDLLDRLSARKWPVGAHGVSALTGQGLDDLLAAIGQRLAPEPPEPGAPLPFLPEQAQTLKRVLELLAEGSGHEATSMLAALLA